MKQTILSNALSTLAEEENRGTSEKQPTGQTGPGSGGGHSHLRSFTSMPEYLRFHFFVGCSEIRAVHRSCFREVIA